MEPTSKVVHGLVDGIFSGNYIIIIIILVFVGSFVYYIDTEECWSIR